MRAISVHFISSLADGGAQKTLFKLASQFSDKQFLICSLRKEGCYRERFLSLENTQVIQFSSLAYSLCFGNLRRKNIIFVGWMYHSCVAAAIFSLLAPKAPLIFNIRQCVHSLGDFKLLTRMSIFLTAFLTWLRRPRVIYVGREAMKTHSRFFFRKANFGIVPNGFSLPSEKKKLDPGENIIRFVSATRFVPQKKLGFMLEGFSSLALEHPDIVLDLYGDGINPGNPELMRLISSFHIEERVNLNGWQGDREKIFNGAHWYLQTSSMEGVSNSIGEAMSFGVVPICSAVGDNKWLIGDAGISFPSGDLFEFERCLRFAIHIQRNDEAAFEARRKQCQKRIQSEFSDSEFFRLWNIELNRHIGRA